MHSSLFALSVLALLGFSQAQYCYNDVASTCSVAGAGAELSSCNAKYSAVHQVLPELSGYVDHHITHSFQHLLMSINFANFEKNRDGFSKLYRKLSDDSWEKAIDLIKYITKRGGSFKFNGFRYEEPNPAFKKTFEMYELESLSRSLDMHKSLAEKAHQIHNEVTKRKVDYHDAETISYLEEEFVHKHADTIRTLAGHTNDLSNLIKGAADSSLSIFLFDEYLKTTV
jgi:ferritin heavy chain